MHQYLYTADLQRHQYLNLRLDKTEQELMIMTTRGRKPWGWSEASHLSSPSTNYTRGLPARRLFRVPPCRKGIIPLQTSMPSPGFEPTPYGIVISVANHYTGWAILKH
ncbi:hypothetical protein TNCV_1485651 [Trichonephila clavipes]|nr:hypothetical protein TNCV_1485651 [Trichonephila clavipes]